MPWEACNQIPGRTFRSHIEGGPTLAWQFRVPKKNVLTFDKA